MCKKRRGKKKVQMDVALFNISPGRKVKLPPRPCIKLRLPGRHSRDKQTLPVFAASLSSNCCHTVVTTGNIQTEGRK